MEGSRNALSLMRASVEDGFSTLMMTSQETNKEDNTMKKIIITMSVFMLLIGIAGSAANAANIESKITPDGAKLIYDPSYSLKATVNSSI